MLELEADHRRHAEIENAIRDLKYGVGLNHLPSGRFPANGAWLAVQSLPHTRYGVMAHNLARWTQRIALGETVATTKTLRRRFLSLAGRITRKARGLILHLLGAGPGKPGSSPLWHGCGPFHCPLDAIPTQGNRFPTKQLKVSPKSRQPGQRGSSADSHPTSWLPQGHSGPPLTLSPANEWNHWPSHPTNLSCKRPKCQPFGGFGLRP